uniref:Uncharacterized protein n=1 Tax=Sphaerodactylus townsendi TaxID=933632 RepID=A0ACB8FBA7_9SAUR
MTQRLAPETRCRLFFLWRGEAAPPRSQRDKLQQLLKDLRAKIFREGEPASESDLNFPGKRRYASRTDLLQERPSIGLIQAKAEQTSAPHPSAFLYLPGPLPDTSLYQRYLEQVEVLTRWTGPHPLWCRGGAVTSTETL